MGLRSLGQCAPMRGLLRAGECRAERGRWGRELSEGVAPLVSTGCPSPKCLPSMSVDGSHLSWVTSYQGRLKQWLWAQPWDKRDGGGKAPPPAGSCSPGSQGPCSMSFSTGGGGQLAPRRPVLLPGQGHLGLESLPLLAAVTHIPLPHGFKSWGFLCLPSVLLLPFSWAASEFTQVSHCCPGFCPWSFLQRRRPLLHLASGPPGYILTPRTSRSFSISGRWTLDHDCLLPALLLLREINSSTSSSLPHSHLLGCPPTQAHLLSDGSSIPQSITHCLLGQYL